MGSGDLMFYGGIVMTAAGILWLLIQAALGPGRKKRVETKMREKY